MKAGRSLRLFFFVVALELAALVILSSLIRGG
jgi:hypothetical protein